MSRRQLPSSWYFTDCRAGELLWSALERLPRGSGVVFRHYELAAPARKALLGQVRAVTRRRRLVLVIGGATYGVRASGTHLGSRGRKRSGFVTMSAHDPAELVRARRAGAALVFVSPVFATRSHAGTPHLGRVRFGLIVQGAGVKVAALGGMTRRRFETMRKLGATAWGAIDAWHAPHTPKR